MATFQRGYTLVAPNDAIKAAKPDATPDAVDEPQNALTGKFTPAEWKAVKELRVRPPHLPLTSHLPHVAITAR